MTIDDLIQQSGTARMDAELLIAHVLSVSRSWVIAHGQNEISIGQSRNIQALMERRKAHEPLSYITGTKEFYGRDFLVTPDVLIPRPATESIVRLALEFLNGTAPKTQEIDAGISAFIERLRPGKIETVIDVGTGSGCIALTLALEGVKQEIIGVDNSEAALTIAKKNQVMLRAKNIEFFVADGPSFVRGFTKPFLMVSNPPYIPTGTLLEKSVAAFEPHEALFAGSDGMEVIRLLMKAARENKACRGMVMEMRTDQQFR